MGWKEDDPGQVSEMIKVGAVDGTSFGHDAKRRSQPPLRLDKGFVNLTIRYKQLNRWQKSQPKLLEEETLHVLEYQGVSSHALPALVSGETLT